MVEFSVSPVHDISSPEKRPRSGCWYTPNTPSTVLVVPESIAEGVGGVTVGASVRGTISVAFYE